MLKAKKSRLFGYIKSHIENNIKEYIIMFGIFVIGIFIGVFFINNISDNELNEISIYFNQFITNLRETSNLSMLELLENSVLQNILIAVIIWFFGTTVIGIPVVFGVILYRGFCLGYTIAVSISVLGLGSGSIFVVTALIIHNILFIPGILALGVSGMKLYKSIVKDKKTDNIKLEIIRHSIFSIIATGIILISSVVETFISTNLLKLVVNYF